MEPINNKGSTEMLWETHRYYENRYAVRSRNSRTPFRTNDPKKAIPKCCNCDEHGDMSYSCP